MRRAQHRRWRRRLGQLAVVGALTLCGGVGLAYAATDIPDPKTTATGQATRVLYADGSELGRLGKSNRIIVELDAVTVGMQQAVLAAEDRNFYRDPGISLSGIARALLTNVRSDSGLHGGSTITQQYVKNAYLTHDRTYARKVREVLLAVKLTRARSKDEVLRDYLNTVYFGRGADGIEAAALTYFAKSASALTIEEAAVLAASLKSPAGYDPTRHPDAARKRWAYVLDGMYAQGWIDVTARHQAKYPTVLAPGVQSSKALRVNDRSGPKGYILSQVERELAEGGFTEARLGQGGLTVHTTLSAQAQQAAEQSVAQAVPAATSNASPVAALVSVRPGTGEVVAYVGGRTGNGGTDYAAEEPRQPGSTFKTFALAAALEDGVPLSARHPGASDQHICGHTVRNAGASPRSVDLIDAMAASVNTVYFRLACNIGPKKVASLAHRVGIPHSVALTEPGGLAPAAGIALGNYEVHVADMAHAYATFAAGGTAARPFMVTQVRDDDKIVYAARSRTKKVLSPQVAADVTTALRAVVEYGTGQQAALSNGQPVAGKTGTTTANRDAWFVGYSPTVATAVWIGRPDRGSLTNMLGQTAVTGGSVPARIFRDYMDVVHAGKPRQFTVPQRPTPKSSPPSSAVPNPSPTDDHDGWLPPEEAVAPPPEPSQSTAPSTEPTPAPGGSATADPTPSASTVA